MLSILILLSCCSIGAAISTDHESRTMRREPHSQGVHASVSARGEILQPSFVAESRAEPANGAANFCNFDFPLGKEGTHDCSASGGSNATGGHSPIPRPELCIHAATQSAAATDHDSFQLKPEWYSAHPKGCFQEKCKAGHCFFFNPSGVTPSGTVTGTPVCWRPKMLNGTVNSAGECPADYVVIDDQAECFRAAECLGHARGEQFEIGIHNSSKHLDYPRGCFIHDTESLNGRDVVYYNGPNKLGAPVNPKGTPICVVKQKNGVGPVYKPTPLKTEAKEEDKGAAKSAAEGTAKSPAEGAKSPATDAKAPATGAKAAAKDAKAPAEGAKEPAKGAKTPSLMAAAPKAAASKAAAPKAAAIGSK